MKNRTTVLLSLLLAALFALAVFSACNNTTNDVTPAPSEAAGSPSGEDVPPAADVTNSPSGEDPTPDLTKEPDPTTAPDPSYPPMEADEWYLERAWAYAELANKVHGFGFEKEKAELKDEGLGSARVDYYNDENDRLSLYFHVNDERKWEVSYSFICGREEYAPELTEEEWEKFDNEVWLLDDPLTVTKAELERAGYKLDGTNEDYVKITEYCGKRLVARFTACSRKNPQRCHAAAAGNARIFALPLIPGEMTHCVYTLYFKPVDPVYFTGRHCDIGCEIADPDAGEYAGWICFGGDVLITPTADGTGYVCEYAFSNDGGALFRQIEVNEDPMDTLKFYIPIVIRTKNESDAYHVIRTFHGMEWERFEELFGADAWERLYPILVDNSTTERDGPDDDYQKYYNMHVLLGAVNAPEKYHKGLAEILKHQRDFDKEIFDRCVGYLDEAGQKKIEAILGK